MTIDNYRSPVLSPEIRRIRSKRGRVGCARKETIFPVEPNNDSNYSLVVSDLWTPIARGRARVLNGSNVR